MGLKDTWQDLENAVAGVENSGSDISVEPINEIAHAVINNEKNKVDKEDGKGLSTEDFTTAEKNKLAGLENYDDEQVVKNSENIDLIDKYGTTDVYILKEGEDITVSENVVTQLLKHDFSNYDAIAFPEGITEINLPDTNNGGNTPLTAKKVIMPKSLKAIGRCSFSNLAQWDDENNLIASSIVVDVKEYVLNEGLETIGSYAFADNIYLEKVNIPESIQVINRGAFQYSDSLKGIFIPATVTKIGDGNFTTTSFDQENATVVYGYAGSEAERYAINENWLKEYANPFVNMGSDYSAELGDIKSAVDHILELDNALLGGDAL